MISLKNKLRVPTVAPTIPPYEPYQNTTVLPMESSKETQMGNEFNLVLLVKEHGRSQIQSIDKELMKLRERMVKLETDRSQIKSLLQAIGEPVE